LPLQGTPFAVFGLGNKQYEHFNAMGKCFQKHLAALGGVPILPLGLGDDDADIADDFELWTSALIDAIDEKGLLQRSSVTVGEARSMQRGYVVQLHAPGSLSNGSTAAGAQRPWVGDSEKHHPILATVAAVRELHAPASERSCVHVEVNLTGTPLCSNARPSLLQGLHLDSSPTAEDAVHV
jgi:NADPH-ferrihemoprotein reductase